MPFNRRAISFRLRKVNEDEDRTLLKPKEAVTNQTVCDSDNNSSDKNKSGVPLRYDNRNASNLSWTKAVSADVIHELQNNKIFKEQQIKNDKKSSSRLSRSYTNIQSSSNNEHLFVTPTVRRLPVASAELLFLGDRQSHQQMANSGNSKIEKRKSTSLTNLVTPKSKKSLEDLLKSFNQIPKEKFNRPDNRFPLDENEEKIQIRETSINRNIRATHSKTADGTLGRRIKQTSPYLYRKFDIRGLIKIQLPNDRSPMKIGNRECIRYENDEFYKVDEAKNIKSLLKRHVTLKSARLLNSKNAELKDCNNLTYTLYFDSNKDAKSFIELDQIQSYVNNDTKTTITKSLLKLLGKRSSREILEKKGIYKNEPIFGNTLRDIYVKGRNEVPPFVYKTIELIERPENITSLGLYRTSGNLATIQKIRFEVDNGRLGILDEYSKDVDVLTGCLKLFFRELREPLITCEICDEILGNIKSDQKTFSKPERDKLRKILSKNLFEANLETLKVLLRHLLEVVKFKDDNKMDTYNLAICWGPTSIFSTSTELSRDIVTQSQEATRLMEFLLNFYLECPEELGCDSRKNETSNLVRQESKDSIGSYDSTSKKSKLGSSTSSLSVDEVIKKTVELIEQRITSEGLYKKSGSVDKTNKLIKKLTKKKIGELEKYKNDVHDITDALKKYLRESQEVMITKEVVERVVATAESVYNNLDLKTAQQIVSILEDTPKKDTLIYILRHLIHVIDNEKHHKVSKTDLLNIWTNVLNYQKKVHSSHETFMTFLNIALDVLDDNNTFEVKNSVKFNLNNNSTVLNSVLKDLKNQQERDRFSRYDNVPEPECRGEASFLDAQVEHTKL